MKKKLTISVDETVIEKAKTSKINISDFVEKALRKKLDRYKKCDKCGGLIPANLCD